jgi:hypothetical protein
MSRGFFAWEAYTAFPGAPWRIGRNRNGILRPLAEFFIGRLK